jgi:hypothetical protein
MSTFAERFCKFYGVQPDDYARTVFRLTAYRGARILAPLLRLLNPDYFACDYSFIRNVGALQRPEDLIDEIRYYFWHPWNRGLLRRTLRLRVSAGRMTKLTALVMTEAGQKQLSWGRPPAGHKRAWKPAA